MSNVNYSLKHKGVRLIASEDAWSKKKIKDNSFCYPLL